MIEEAIVLEYDRAKLRGLLMEAEKDRLVRTAAHEWDCTGIAAAEGAEEGGEEKAAGGEVTVEDAEPPLTAAFRAAAKHFGTHEFELALPLSGLLAKVLRLPLEAREELNEAALSALEGISPFPDELLLPAVEVVSETDTELVAVAAALPEESAAELSAALAEAKVQITRTDVTALGWLRTLWPQVCARQGVQWRIVLLHLGEEWDVMLLERDALTALRGLGKVGSAAALGREITLSLMQAEIGDGDAAGEVVVAAKELPGGEWTEWLEKFGPVRFVRIEDDWGGAEGVARRLEEETTFDMTPEPWREDLLETRFRSKLKIWCGAAAGVWLLLTGGMYGAEMAWGWMANRQKDLRKERAHAAAYKEVSNMKSRVELIARYTDKSKSALDMLKTVTECLPDSEAMIFKSFQFARGESVKVSGTAGAREEVRSFTENMEGATFESDGETKVFPLVRQTGGETLRKDGTVNYTIEGFFAESTAVAEGAAK